MAVKVFKKVSPDGEFTVYLGQRDFVDHFSHTDPIHGVIVADKEFIKGKKIFGHVVAIFRYGREEEEVMGLKFSKNLYVCQEQIFPTKQPKTLTPLQEKLLRRLGHCAHPFMLELPPNSPCSVTLQPGGNYDGQPLGVQYLLEIYVGHEQITKPLRRNTVGFAIRKVQFAPSTKRSSYKPHINVSKSFTLSPGRVALDLTLDRDLFYHGETVSVCLGVNNMSKKTVRSIKLAIIQICELTMINTQYTRTVTSIETKEGCPIGPGETFNRDFHLVPSVTNKDKRGIALDGRLRDKDAHLASTTLFSESQSPDDAVGIVVSYAVRARLYVGTLGGEVVADLPFKLMHPMPGTETAEILKTEAANRRAAFRQKAISRQSVDVVFEDFAKLRMSIDEYASEE